MAQYGYYPQYFNAAQYQPQAAPQQTAPGIVWVQGEAGAKSYLVGAGQSVLLMDSEGSCFYIKSTDASGMPLPLRIFDYTERTQAHAPAAPAGGAGFDPDKYVTREEFEELKAAVTKKKGGQKDGE